MVKKLHGVQVLRGLAALLVCCFHARMLLNGDINYGIMFFGKGNIGVPLFFIISGFIMVYSTKDLGTNLYSNFKTFLVKRIFRIAPIYYMLTLTIIFLSSVIPYYLDREGLIELVRILLFIPKNNDTPLLVGWTLSYEILFYIIFAFSLLFSKWRYHFLYSIFIILIFFVPLFSDKAISFETAETNYFDYLYLNLATNGFMLYFLVGVFIGNCYSSIQLKRQTSIFLLFLSICIFFSYYFGLFKFIQSDLVVCALLVFSVVHAPAGGSKLKKRDFSFFSYLGEISYSIYLLHPIFIIFLPVCFSKVGLGMVTESKFMFLFIVLFTLLASMLSHELIEVRFTRFLKKRLLGLKSENSIGKNIFPNRQLN